jgi:hypothetical protein
MLNLRVLLLNRNNFEIFTGLQAGTNGNIASILNQTCLNVSIQIIFTKTKANNGEDKIRNWTQLSLVSPSRRESGSRTQCISMISESLYLDSRFQAGIRIEYVPKDTPESYQCNSDWETFTKLHSISNVWVDLNIRFTYSENQRVDSSHFPFMP